MEFDSYWLLPNEQWIQLADARDETPGSLSFNQTNPQTQLATQIAYQCPTVASARSGKT